MNRRDLLLAVAVLSAGKTLAACGGGSGGGAPTAGNQEPDAWTPAPYLFAGDTVFVFDLAQTLPANVRRGGQFRVDSSGAALPSGVSLAPSGVLSLTAAAAVGFTSGVVFAYTEPA
jgi:hypothetical protein